MADDSPETPEPEDPPEAFEEGDAYVDEPFTSADFHNVVQKQFAHAAMEMLAQAKMPWHLVAPFLDAARDLMADDLRDAGRIRLHTLQADGNSWVDAEEAFLGIEIDDRDTGQPWLSETWWLSDIVTANDDPDEVRAVIRALQRTTDKLETWLKEKGGPGGEGETTPPEPGGETG